MPVGSVVLLLVPPAAGAAAGYATGGRLLGLTTIRFRALWLLFLAAFLQAAWYYISPARDLIEHRAGLPALGALGHIHPPDRPGPPRGRAALEPGGHVGSPIPAARSQYLMRN